MRTVQVFNGGQPVTLRLFSFGNHQIRSPGFPEITIAENAIAEVDEDFWSAWAAQNSQSSLLTTHTLFVVTSREVSPWPQN